KTLYVDRQMEGIASSKGGYYALRKTAKSAGKRTGPRRRLRRWSREVTERSNALDLEQDVFKQRSARAVAESLRRSAERSRRRKGTAFQSAMSMLTFYLNRAGRNLAPSRQRALEGAKDALRRLYGRA